MLYYSLLHLNFLYYSTLITSLKPFLLHNHSGVCISIGLYLVPLNNSFHLSTTIYCEFFLIFYLYIILTYLHLPFSLFSLYLCYNNAILLLIKFYFFIFFTTIIPKNINLSTFLFESITSMYLQHNQFLHLKVHVLFLYHEFSLNNLYNNNL